MTKNKKPDANKEFEIFKVKLGKYIKTTRPHGTTKPEAAAELNTSLSKYNSYEDPNNEYGRQSISIDFLFHLAKRDGCSVSEIIEKIDAIDKKPSTHFEKDSKAKVTDMVIEKVSKTNKVDDYYQIRKLLTEAQNETPKADTLNTDPESWFLHINKCILALSTEDRVELIYSLIKKIIHRQKFNEIKKDIDFSLNENFMKNAVNHFIKLKKQEFIDIKTM